MPKKYSIDFKQASISYYTNCKTVKVTNVLSIFGISNGSLFNWIKLKKYNKLRDNRIQYTRKSKYTPAIKCYMRCYVIKRISFNYKLLIRQLKLKFNISSSKSSIYAILNKMILFAS